MMIATTSSAAGAHAADRMVQAERQGLRLAILCRTVVIALAATYWVGAITFVGGEVRPVALAILVGLLVFGIVTYLLIGTKFDRRWLKFAIYATDILAVCALFAFVPLRSGAEVPQILAFRSFGIYYLFPLIALACLSLSWRLVIWSGAVAVAGWWAAFFYVISDMSVQLNWGDFPDNAGLADYQAIFLSENFVGVGNRISETGMLFFSAAILALAVYRARRVFFAQIRAEAERERERQARERLSATLGRYVPESIANRLLEDESALAPQERHGVVLVMDIVNFTRFASDRTPTEVIERLNDFLAGAADAIADRDGVVIQFTGDGVLATFNAPIEIAHPETAAMEAARALVDQAREAGFAIRVGIAAGTVAAGSIGSARRRAFTVYGDTVNRSARLETLAKQIDATIVLDADCAEALGGAYAIEPAGDYRLQGFPDPVPVFVPRSGEGTAG